MSEKKKYIIEPNYKKSAYQVDEWENTLKNRKKVTITVTSFYRGGTFEIFLSDDEKNEIVTMNDVVLNNYDFDMLELFDGCHMYVEISDEDKYSKKELQEIKELIYCDITEPEYEYDSEESFDLDEILLCDNGWTECDTVYGFTCSVNLKVCNH